MGGKIFTIANTHFFALRKQEELKNSEALRAAHRLTADDLKEMITPEALYTQMKKGLRHLKINFEVLNKQRFLLTSLIDYYKGLLASTNPATFPFSKKRKEEVREELTYAFYLLYAQYRLNLAEEKDYLYKKDIEALALCNQRLQELDGTITKKSDPEQSLQADLNLSQKCLKFLGQTILAVLLVDTMQQLIGDYDSTKTGTVIREMSAVNMWRLKWVWGGGLLSSVLEMLPDNFYNKMQTQQAVAAPAPVTGYMSWLLYYTRFGINVLLLAKHTFLPSKEESQIPIYERFKTQWQQRKFILLNDSIWATANMACFFWLRGSGMMGYAGNLVTVGLLCMDIFVTTWRFWEEATAHNKAMLAFQRDRKQLENEKDALIQQLLVSKEGDTEDLAKEIKNLTYQIGQLDKMKAKAEFEWKYKRLGLINDLAYAVCLMMSFSVLCCFFFPPASIVPAAAMITAVVGAALCFAFTTAYAAIGAAINVAKSVEAGKLAREECASLLEKFGQSTDDNERKQLYLEMKALMADSEYQQKLARFQAVKMIRSTLVDALVPAVIFVSFTFMPLGVGLGILATGIALAIISNAIIDRFAPEQAELPAFDEEDYNSFKSDENRSLDHFKTEKSSWISFSQWGNKSNYQQLNTSAEELQLQLQPVAAQ